MKKHLFLCCLSFLLLLGSCANGQHAGTGNHLSATEFQAKARQQPDAMLLDVRTPQEFAKGHLANARNLDWNADDFALKVAKLDKNQPMYVYCLSGGRSHAAAEKMRADGFKEVYEMDGGLMKWRAAKLPEVTGNTDARPGLSKAQFEELIVSDKVVLVDFYADWCAPCKKMKPYLDEIARDMAATVTVVRINADENPELCKALNIDGLPVLQVYRNKSLSWSNLGFVDKATVVSKLQ